MNVLKSASLLLFTAFILSNPSLSCDSHSILCGDTTEGPDFMNGDPTLTCAHCWTHSHSCHHEPQSFPFRLFPAGDKISCGCTLRHNQINCVFHLHFFCEFCHQNSLNLFECSIWSFMIPGAGSSKWTLDWLFHACYPRKAVKGSGDDLKSRISKSAVCGHTTLSPSLHQLLLGPMTPM